MVLPGMATCSSTVDWKVFNSIVSTLIWKQSDYGRKGRCARKRILHSADVIHWGEKPSPVPLEL